MWYQWHTVEQLFPFVVCATGVVLLSAETSVQAALSFTGTNPSHQFRKKHVGIVLKTGAREKEMKIKWLKYYIYNFNVKCKQCGFRCHVDQDNHILQLI